MALFSEKRGELVHDAAFHTAVVVLGGLPDPCQFELINVSAMAAAAARMSIPSRLDRRKFDELKICDPEFYIKK